uniref:Uncharacterized protein n=1 Tax=Arundo donax TaxID=35708 RepID=A0A0A9EZ70_ARUDO
MKSRQNIQPREKINITF